MKTKTTMTAILESRNERQDSTTRPPEPTVDQWFAKARDNENDFRNLTVEDYRRNMTALADVADARIEKLTAQRDELLAAAKAFTHDCDCYDGMNIEQFNSWKAIQTAIAKCEANK